ncbi:hypothetical protein B0A48_17833 [Cryoendolithus antarcticus]|uniref:Azaphilone pigments biosynthesis cluster protein L N-terminal domain-containing protein n=1 Tax=Cryoendolithus antarcticus TaxID=1507870 RepID=A0A1V8SBS9_9PEZI|nr:hypothetical protein B0A48_17833 [Cryoendolithus antarcticus]
MAEFGIAAGVLQVASFGADVSSALYKSIRDVKNAARDIQALAEEVDATTNVLDAVASLLGNPKTASLHTTQLIKDTENVLDGCRKVFGELDRAAKQASDGLVEQSTWGRLTTKAKWPLSKGRVIELQGVLERYRSVMHMMLTVLQIGEGRSAATTKDLQGLEQRLEALITTRISLGQDKSTIYNALDDITQVPAISDHVHQPSLSQSSESAEGQHVDAPKALGRSSTGTRQSTEASTLAVRNARAVDLLNLNFVAAALPLKPPEPRARELANPTPDLGADLSTVRPELLVPEDPIFADLEQCKAAVDQLALSLAATLAQLQGQPHENSTDINAALEDALRQSRKLSAGMRCKRCDRQIPWRHARQVRNQCKDGRACDVRGLSSRIIAPGYSVRHIDTKDTVMIQGETQISINPEPRSVQQITNTSASRRQAKRILVVHKASTSMPAYRRPTAREPLVRREVQGIPQRDTEHRLSRAESPDSTYSLARVIRRGSFTIERRTAARSDRYPMDVGSRTVTDERSPGSRLSDYDRLSGPPIVSRYDSGRLRQSSIDPSRDYPSACGRDSVEDEEDAVSGVRVVSRIRPESSRQSDPATLVPSLRTTRSMEQLGSTLPSSRNHRRTHSEGSTVLPDTFIPTSTTMPSAYAHVRYSRPPVLVRESRPYARSSAAHAEDSWARPQREAAECQDSWTLSSPPLRSESRNREISPAVATDAAAALLKRWLLPEPGNELVV